MNGHRPPILASILLLCAATGHADAQEPDLPEDPGVEHAWVIFGSDTIHAELARTGEERERGLMFRDDVPDGTGMLFVFPEPGVHGVWMKDTEVALDVAFLDSAFTVIGIEPLQPHDLTVKYSPGPALFVLEVPRGWFEEHDVERGDRATIVFGRR